MKFHFEYRKGITMGVSKDDVMEMHDTIVALEKKQKKAIKMVTDGLSELEDIGELLSSLRKSYEELKSKTGNK
jgi:hypothetical protein